MNPSEGVREIAEKIVWDKENKRSCTWAYGAIVSALTQAEKRGFERARAEAAKVAEECEMSEKAIETLRCNPGAKRPYVGSQERNGYDWACSDIADAIRNLTYEKKECV